MRERVGDGKILSVLDHFWNGKILVTELVILASRKDNFTTLQF